MSRDRKLLELAAIVAQQGRCKRRQIGCVLVDDDGTFTVTGFNGPPESMPSCFDEPCPAANVPAGAGPQSGCLGVHAEIMALIEWPPDRILETCYCTKMPCNQCVLTLLNTSCKKIVCRIPANDKTGAELWVRAGRELIYDN